MTALLLCVAAYAVVVSAVHHHGFKSSTSEAITRHLPSNGDRTASHNDSSCTSCRLQRTLESSDRSPAPLVVTVDQAPALTTPLIARAVSRPTFTLAARAPPLS
jgi:hypothetical protein